MSITQGPVRVAKPRDLADWPVFVTLARLFWGCAALLTADMAGLIFFAHVLASADSGGRRSPWPSLWTPALQIAVGAVVLLGLYFAPGFRRLSRMARLALLGPLACAVPVFAVLWAYATAA
ncbi:hypothetical protein GFH48_17475 [Streptomyces fagopyri]|uniref:Uncharacterized protein n=1 Tax=Streptomyces fagopyri TaxID=2662397 RepID=A0A5Q0LDA2_9ACTN|nr:hypothetical protein [Streptomyces fagopyri]QFZ74824.1 hypothetical protein GFH48_17475 [Streptomyces fagopyri]